MGIETVILVILGVVLSGQGALWYKMGKVEQAVNNHRLLPHSMPIGGEHGSGE